MSTSTSEPTANPKPEGIFNSMDGPDLVPLLQCIGFILISMDKSGHVDELPKLSNNQQGNVMKVEITCVKSGTKITLLKENCVCKCPSEEVESWNISGCVQGNVSGTKSNLVPTMPPVITKAVTVLLLKCMELINSASANDSADVVGEFRPNSSKTTLGSSTPKHRSSSIPDLCQSLKNSRSSSEGTDNLTDVLKRIDQMVKQAMELAVAANATYIKTPGILDSLKISPLIPVSTLPEPKLGGGGGSKLAESDETPSISTPKKQSLTTGTKKKGLLPPSRLNLLKYKREGSVSSVGKATSTMVKDRTGKSINLSTAKLKTALSVESNLQTKLKPRTTFGSKIGLKK